VKVPRLKVRTGTVVRVWHTPQHWRDDGTPWPERSFATQPEFLEPTWHPPANGQPGFTSFDPPNHHKDQWAGQQRCDECGRLKHHKEQKRCDAARALPIRGHTDARAANLPSIVRSLRRWASKPDHFSRDQNILTAKHLNVRFTSGYGGGFRRFWIPRHKVRAKPELRDLIICPADDEAPIQRRHEEFWTNTRWYIPRRRSAIPTSRALAPAPDVPFSWITVATMRERMPHVVERVEQAMLRTQKRRDRFDRDIRTKKLHQWLLEHAEQIKLGHWSRSVREDLFCRRAGSWLWFAAKGPDGLKDLPEVFRRTRPISKKTQKRRERKLDELIEAQKADKASGGMVGPGRFLDEADQGKGLPIYTSDIDKMVGMRDTNSGKVKPRGKGHTGNDDEGWLARIASKPGRKTSRSVRKMFGKS
jgi:hypothetical protein